MVFRPESWIAPLPDVPDVPLTTFLFDERYGRSSYKTSLDPYICSVTNTKIAAKEQHERVETLAAGICNALHWDVNVGSEVDKVIAVFASNTIDIPTVTWAIHRLGGVCSPINAAYTPSEVASLLRKSNAKALFTVSPLLPTARAAVKIAAWTSQRIFILPMPGERQAVTDESSLAYLVQQGRLGSKLMPLLWPQGEAKRRIAFLSHSSGTSGPPKMAAVSHHNIMANVMQLTAFDCQGRGGAEVRQVVLGVLPSSHVYGVVVISTLSTYRGDSVIVLPRFDLREVLAATQRFKIDILSVVPPIIVAMGKSLDLLQRYDLSSVKVVLSGGAALDDGTITRLHQYYPRWLFRNAYGMTEVGGCVTMTGHHEVWPGSSGVIIPGVTLKLMSPDGSEVTGLDQPGEVYARSPAVVLGYWSDAEATRETFVNHGGETWLRTGDVGLFRRSSSGDAHIFIVDRVKELIKVKGFQVSPAELEACLLEHGAVQDCAVTSIRDERAGELPRAFVERSRTHHLEMSESDLRLALYNRVKAEKARHKWLDGGIVFVDSIPRSPAGKILRRLLKDVARETKL